MSGPTLLYIYMISIDPCRWTRNLLNTWSWTSSAKRTATKLRWTTSTRQWKSRPLRRHRSQHRRAPPKAARPKSQRRKDPRRLGFGGSVGRCPHSHIAHNIQTTNNFHIIILDPQCLLFLNIFNRLALSISSNPEIPNCICLRFNRLALSVLPI